MINIMVTKLTNIIESNNVSIDSLQIRIPEFLCEFRHTDLTDKKFIVNTNGETVGTIEPNKHLSSYTGITVIFKIKQVAVWNPSTRKVYHKPYLCIGIPAKVLKSDYLEGITAKNLENVYKYLQSLEVASFDYSDFKDSLSTDIDFKCDFNISELGYDNYNKFTKDIELVAKNPPQRNLGFNRFKTATNKGIEFQTRKNTHRNIVFPYLKLYSKRIEALSKNSIEFTDTYLDIKKVKDSRAETTVKDKKHLKSLGIKDNSLINLVNLSKEKKQNILINAINRNLIGETITKVKKSNRKMPLFDYVFCLMAENKCMSLIEAINIAERHGNFSKQVWFNFRKRLDKLELSY